jgi:hypothetical protein
MNLSYRHRQELLKLAGYFAGTAIAGIPVAITLGQAWRETPYGLPQEVILAFHTATGIDLILPFFFLIGIYLAPATLLLVDRYKRPQGVIVWTGITLTAVLVLLPANLLIEPLVNRFSLVGAVVFVAGFLAGLRLCNVSYTILLERDPELVFPDAPARLQQFTLFGVVVGLFEAGVQYHSPIYISQNAVAYRQPELVGVSVDAVVVLGTVSAIPLAVGLTKFLRYESSTRTLQIGPQRSGKTASFGGIYKRIEEKNPGTLVQSAAGVSAAEERASKIGNGEFRSGTEMGEIDLLGVSYESTGLFNEELQLQSIDYPGEALASALRPVLSSGSPEMQTDGGQESIEFDDEMPDKDPDGNSDENGPQDSPSRSADYQDYGAATDWEDAVENVQNLSAGLTPNKYVGPAVWNCIEYADRIILTIPFDDFIGPMLARRDEDAVDYMSFEKTEDPMEVGDDRKILWRDDETIYYYPERPDRPRPEKYLKWYHTLMAEADEVFDSNTEFIIAVTMGDLAKEDFEKQPYNNISEYREHVTKIMVEADNRVQTLLNGVYEDEPFVLWYRINEDSPPEEDSNLTIDTEAPGPVLRGADELLSRLEA